jgi:hypothetical protein
VDAARDLLGTEEAPEEASSPEESAAQEGEHEAEFDLPNLDVEVPEDYAEISEMPDFEAEAEAELGVQESQQHEQEEYEYEDDGIVQERKKRLAAEKRAAWLEQQHRMANEGKWKAEAAKYYPLAQPFIDSGLIKADSRRAFAREAKKVHEAMKPYIAEKFLRPFEEEMKRRESGEVDQNREQEKADWGKPMAGPNQPPAQSERKVQQYEQNKRNPTLVDEIKSMVFE